MPGDNPTQTSVDLEAKARVFLFSDELTEKTSQLAKIFGLSDKAQDDLAVLENAVVFKEISISAFIEKIKNLPLSSKKSSADFALAVAESFLLPLNEYLDGEPKRLLEKIAPKSQVVFRESLPRPKETSIKSLPVKPVDPRAVKIAEAVITEINLGDKNLESKLREIVVARVTGAKDDLETKAMLKRSAQTGGVGLEDSLADTLLGLIKTKAGETPKTEIQNSSKPVKEQINSSVVIPNLIGDPVFDSAQTQRKNVDSLARGERRAGVNPAELRGGNDKSKGELLCLDINRPLVFFIFTRRSRAGRALVFVFGFGLFRGIHRGADFLGGGREFVGGALDRFHVVAVLHLFQGFNFFLD